MLCRHRSFWLVVCLIAVVGVPSIVPAQQQGESFQVAIPTDVVIQHGESLVLILEGSRSSRQLRARREFQCHTTQSFSMKAEDMLPSALRFWFTSPGANGYVMVRGCESSV